MCVEYVVYIKSLVLSFNHKNTSDVNVIDSRCHCIIRFMLSEANCLTGRLQFAESVIRRTQEVDASTSKYRRLILLYKYIIRLRLASACRVENQTPDNCGRGKGFMSRGLILAGPDRAGQ